MDKAFVKGLVRDWGVALAIGALIFIAWKLMAGGPVTTGRIDSVRMLDLAGEEVDPQLLRNGQTYRSEFFGRRGAGLAWWNSHFVSYQKNHPDITVLGVSLDENKSLSALQAFAKHRNMNYTVLHDTLYNEAIATVYRLYRRHMCWALTVRFDRFVLESSRKYTRPNGSGGSVTLRLFVFFPKVIHSLRFVVEKNLM